MCYYTVYLNKDDTIVASGTAKECANAMGKSVNCFHSMVSKNKKGIQKKYFVVIEKYEPDDSPEEAAASH